MTVEPESKITYFEIDPDFNLKAVPGPPLDWRSMAGAQVEEEVLETLLSLHLDEITEEPIVLLARGGEHWGIADLMAVDPFNRIHIFELKRGHVNLQAVEQLNQYLLGHVFEDPQPLVQKWWGEYRPRILGERLALYFAGAYSGIRTSTLGWQFVAQWRSVVPEHGLKPDLKTKSQWLKIPEARRIELLTTAVLHHAIQHANLPPDEVPALPRLQQLAEIWSARLTPTPDPPVPILRANRKAVIWLVGRSIDEAAMKRIRRWRRAGIDARWLAIHAQRAAQQPQWYLRVESENASQRKELSRKIREWAEKNEEIAKGSTVTFNLYEEKAPSDQAFDEGGGLKPVCKAKLFTPKGTEEIGCRCKREGP